jgi:hypothetical protein
MSIGDTVELWRDNIPYKKGIVMKTGAMIGVIGPRICGLFNADVYNFYASRMVLTEKCKTQRFNDSFANR